MSRTFELTPRLTIRQNVPLACTGGTPTADRSERAH